MRLATPPGPPSLILGYGNLSETVIPRVIREVAQAVVGTAS
jgi:hypothetical protein